MCRETRRQLSFLKTWIFLLHCLPIIGHQTGAAVKTVHGGDVDDFGVGFRKGGFIVMETPPFSTGMPKPGLCPRALPRTDPWPRPVRRTEVSKSGVY